MLKNTLKNILSRRTIDRLKIYIGWADLQIVKVASRSRWLSALYYFLVSPDFRREMQVVLLARRRYSEALKGVAPSSYLLRRNIHRLEKGLVMRPRRDVFGEDYIIETVEYLELCIKHSILLDSEYIWACKVLKEYFSAVTSTAKIDHAKGMFFGFVNENSITYPSTSGPRSHASLSASHVAFADFKSLCERRHSIRDFKSKVVPLDLLNKAIDVALTAPSACNRQPLKFFVFDDPKRAQEIGSIPMGTAGFSKSFQCVVVIVGDLSAYPFEKDRHIIYIDGALAAMQFELAIESLGLGTCTINWPDVERHERRMANELELLPHERPVMLIAVGYPSEGAFVPASVKKSSHDLVVRP